MSNKKLNHINEQIESIKKELLEMNAMRPGTLSQQYKSPQKKTGSYWQLSYNRRMKSHTEYIRPASVPEIRQQIATYKRFKTLVDRWLDLAIEYSKLKIQVTDEKDTK